MTLLNTARKRVGISKRIAVVAIAGAAVLGVTGCSEASGSPGTAFVVNEHHFSEKDLTETTDQLSLLTGMEPPRFEIAQTVARAYAFLDAAESAGVSLSDADFQAAMESYVMATGSPVDLDTIALGTKVWLNAELLNEQLMAADLTEDQITTILVGQETADVVMNPRYEVQ